MPLSITNINPKKGIKGSGINIEGTGLNNVTQAYFNESDQCPGTITSKSNTLLRVTVPKNAQSGKIKVVTEKGDSAVSSASFTI